MSYHNYDFSQNLMHSNLTYCSRLSNCVFLAVFYGGAGLYNVMLSVLTPSLIGCSRRSWSFIFFYFILFYIKELKKLLENRYGPLKAVLANTKLVACGPTSLRPVGSTTGKHEFGSPEIVLTLKECLLFRSWKSFPP